MEVFFIVFVGLIILVGFNIKLVVGKHISGFSVLSATSIEPLRLTLLPEWITEEFGAKCLDGSPAGYYFRKAPVGSRNSNSWAIYLEGGGVCVEIIDCEMRKRSKLGSSHYFKSTRFDSNNVLNPKAEENRHFFDYNHVLIPYCTGDFHSGRRGLSPTTVGQFYFAGHQVLEAIVVALRLAGQSNFSRADADASWDKGLEAPNAHVFLTGQSAGGIGVFQNADWLVERLPGAVVRAAPQAGFYFPPNVTLFPFWNVGIPLPFPYISAFYLELWFHAFVDVTCANAHTKYPELCWDAAVLYKFIDTPLFIAENLFDSNQMSFLLVPMNKINTNAQVRDYIRFYGQEMMKVMRLVPESQKGDGLFVPSCLDHTDDLCPGTTIGTRIGTVTFQESLSAWMDASNNVSTILIDKCDEPQAKNDTSLPCNPSCKCSGNGPGQGNDEVIKTFERKSREALSRLISKLKSFKDRWQFLYERMIL